MAESLPKKSWYIAIVNNNTELSAQKALKHLYEIYVPTQKVLSVYSNGQRRLRDKVIIPGRLLVHCTEKERLESLNNHYLQRYMVDCAGRKNEFGRRPIAVIPDYQVDNLKLVLSQYQQPVIIDNQNLRQGEKVIVISGELKGLIGEVYQWSKTSTQLFIRLDNLGCAKVEVSLNQIERLPNQ